MCQISIRIPDAVMYDTHMSEEEAAAFARCMVAVGYYTQNNAVSYTHLTLPTN